VFADEADSIGDMLGNFQSTVNDDWEKLFNGILKDCAERLRRDPADFEALVRGVTVYMVVIEGTLALTAARFIVKSLKERNAFPGFLQGFTAVNRDESRHVGFGIKFLSDAIKADPANATVVEETLRETLPVAPLVFVPPWVDDPYDFETPFYHSSEIFEYAMRSLSKKLAAMGLDPTLLAEGVAA
jgi:ribonucleoside-diphosphate reductase beta chain